jgi:hypothetical protein
MPAIIKPENDFRIYIGPHHLHYNWSGLNLGATFAAGLFAQRTTTATQSSGATTLTVNAVASWPTVGGVWVGPNGSGESWEYERFPSRVTTTLTVERESSTDREHNGVHTSGAKVFCFYPVTTNDGTLNITDECDDTVSAITWRGTASGVLAPQHVLRNGHVVVVTLSENGGAYTIFLVGFVQNPQITDDYGSNARWTFDIVSSAALVAEEEASGVRVGNADLADAGSASSSVELVLPFDERFSGDFTAAAPDLSAASAIDDDLSTIWIAEHFTGTDIWYTASNSDPENNYTLRFEHLYLNPPPAAGPGARFIGMSVMSNASIRGMALNSANGGVGPNGCEIWIFNGPGDVSPGHRIFLVEDEEVFNRLNPLVGDATIYEWREFFAHILPIGGEFWLRLGELNMWQARVRWGTGNGNVQHPDAPSRTWTGATVTAPALGQTMRYRHNITSGTAAARWQTGYIRHTGYNIDDDDPIWIMVALPGLGLTLAQSMTSTVPGNGEFLYINGPDDKWSTDGLPASGTLFVGDEKIAYSSKTESYVVLAASSARGSGGTTATAHNAKDEVYVMDGSTPTDAYLIKSVGWNGGASTIYPKWFKIYTSNLIDNVRTPDDTDYVNDWTLRVNVTNNTASSYTHALSNIRVKHVLIEIMSMTTDPARPRLTEINALVDSSLHNAAQWLAADTSAGALISQILQTAGIWSGAISHSGTATLSETTTATDNAWTVVTDIAEYSGSLVSVARDSKFVISANPFWTGTPTVVTTWNRTSASTVQKSFRRNSPVSQVILPWKTPSGSSSGKIYYPQLPGRGTRLEKTETLYASSSAAEGAARRLYFMRLYPFEANVTAAGQVVDKRAGEAHQMVWQFTGDMQPLERLYLCLSADHRLEDGFWSSSFRLMQYGHESNF